MATLRIPCPNCRKSLQLPDRRYLGRRGKCAACGHSFVLREPEPEIELQPVEHESAKLRPGRGQEPISGQPFAPPDSLPAIETPTAAENLALVQELRRRRKKRRVAAVAAGAVTAVAIMAAFLLIRSQWDSRASGSSPARSAPRVDPDDIRPASIVGLPFSTAILKANVELVAAAEPTDGPPIDLRMMPSGVNCVIHLRPAELWADTPAAQELRAALTKNITDWIARQLKTVCRRDPSQIEEALIGILLGPTGSTPEVATVVRLKEPARLSDLVEEFGGEPLRLDSSVRLLRSSTHAYLIPDERTFAISPAALAEDLANWVDLPNHNTTDGILQLLEHTDRQRLFTVVFEVSDVRRHEEWLFDAAARPAFHAILDLFGEEAETIAWSVHLGEHLHSELHVRTRVTGEEDILGPRRLAETLAARFEQSPQQLMQEIREWNPTAPGPRQFIGRLPAMLEAARQSTVATTGERRVQFTTLLPPNAAPNFALATLLAWDASRRVAEAAPKAIVAQDRPQLPETVAERLKLPVDAEFRRTPLRDAFAYICGEIQVNLEIDGDALKDAGYTQNLPQVFNIGTVPADVAISKIISQYDGDGKEELRMVVAVDEQTRTLHVLTRKFAEQKGMTPLDLPPPP